MSVRLPRLRSPNSTTPSISAMMAGSFGRRASNSSVTRGRPPVMSCVPVISRGVLASNWPGTTFSPSSTSMKAFSGIEYTPRICPSLVLDHDLRMVVALVLDDDLALEAGGWSVSSRKVTSAMNSSNATVPPTSVRMGMVCGSHLASGLRTGTFSSFLDQQDRAGLDDVLVQFAAALVHDVDFGVAVEHDVFVLVVDHRLHVGELDRAGAAAAHFGFFHRALPQAADVEGAHGELRARLAHRLRRDDADRRADLHQRRRWRGPCRSTSAQAP